MKNCFSKCLQACTNIQLPKYKNFVILVSMTSLLKYLKVDLFSQKAPKL